jgi:hypothetical protein
MIPGINICVEVAVPPQPYVELAVAPAWIESWNWNWRGFTGRTSTADIRLFGDYGVPRSGLRINYEDFLPGRYDMDIQRPVEVVLRVVKPGLYPDRPAPLDIARMEIFPGRPEYKQGEARPWQYSGPGYWRIRAQSRHGGFQELCLPDRGVHMDLATILEVCAHPLELVLRYAHPLPDKPEPKEPTVKTSRIFEIFFETEHPSSTDISTVTNRLRNALYEKFERRTVDGIPITSMGIVVKEEKHVKPDSWKDVLDGSKLANKGCVDMSEAAKKAGYEFFSFGSNVYRVNGISSNTVVCQTSELK